MPYSEIGPFELLQARQVIESNITGFAASQISFNELQELKENHWITGKSHRCGK